MRISGLYLRRKRIYPQHKGIFKEQFETNLAPPRARAKNPNDHWFNIGRFTLNIQNNFRSIHGVQNLSKSRGDTYHRYIFYLLLIV